ncbi:hypothetical protein GCM10007049_02600 [Echinicola pacifica]|uniref:Uncharacterized protein n=1 Tax=Echinicola pacifica TaxID=346377 RepID=A0A918PLZ0_9BACT|nr:hypothetical protein GCM10007049_02600 [Echinicola pacifica]
MYVRMIIIGRANEQIREGAYEECRLSADVYADASTLPADSGLIDAWSLH